MTVRPLSQLSKCGFNFLPHSLYSPDLAPSDFSLFLTLKDELRGRTFGSEDDVIVAVEECDWIPNHNGIAKLEQAGLNVFRYRVTLLKKCYGATKSWSATDFLNVARIYDDWLFIIIKLCWTAGALQVSSIL